MLPLVRRESKCGNLEASLSLRHRQEEAKERQHKAAMEKADNMSDWLTRKMKALKTEEGLWRWKRHKEARQLDVEKAALNARKAEVSLAAKTIDRKKMALNKERKEMDGKQEALGRTSAKLTGEKKVGLFTHTTVIFYSLTFPVLTPDLSRRFNLRHFEEGTLRLRRFEGFGISGQSKRIKI
jgi:hypothetical protein